MRLLILFVLAIVLFPSISYTQVSAGTESDSTKLAQRALKVKRVDSLRKFTRNQFYRNNYDLAIEVGEETLKLAREINDYKTIFSISSIMGNAFLKIEDTTQAKRIFTEALVEAEQIQANRIVSKDALEEDRYNDDRSIITALIDLGNYYALQEKAEPAIKLYNEAIPLAEKLHDTSHLFILNFNIAELNLDQENIKTAEYYVMQTNNYISNSTVDAYRAVAKLNVGKLHYLKKEPGLAIKNLRESIELAEKSGFTDPLIEGYDFYAKAEALNGNYSAAYALIQKADEYRAEKYKTDKIEAIETVTAKFKLNQFQQELKAQALQNEVNTQTTKRETTILWVKIASGILLIFSLFLFGSYRKRKKLLIDLIHKNKQYLEAKEKSEELSKAKTVLFSNITHELRTPMYGIIGISNILIKDKKIKSHDEDLKSLKFSANYLFSLINNVLQLTQIENTKKEELEKTKFNLENLINNVVESSKFLNEEHPNNYKIIIDKKIPKYLFGDEVNLTQVLINIVGNASKFTNDGTITIQVDRGADKGNEICLQFLVKDTGIGISKEKQENIFDEFAQTTGSGNQYQGARLGLPIVKKILELHGSEIDLKSEEGKGTEIRFDLYYTPGSKAEAQVQNTVTNALPLKGTHILVVDDNKINQLVTQKYIETYGATAKVAGSGADAIRMTKSEEFDLILMDINMPEMNGFEATERIRTFNTDIPIIALTAVELEKVVGEHSFNLMNDLIIKPYKNEVFIETLLKHISK
ncbi:signal transduction histidine kinase [Ulvibacter sp. MAR_2010_11]|uniref:ATP-binding response regulator n=1 Tax=Ulvibacter sp. MAR_2010_11 TaxID=1250229 RepID=UPI000C2BC62A|nr:ATP-binding protein [Ulvibacter sp. MAR_2010_11]PKA83603.1 signal transduction histidine kinase [Ulvibacter sp. MAR_2010_11]